MAHTINKPNLSHAWASALGYLMSTEGKAINLVVSYQAVEQEDFRIRKLIDDFLDSIKLPPVTGVANTLFPQGLYHPKLMGEAREHLFRHYRQFYEGVGHRYSGNGHGTYFYRLIVWADKKKPLNRHVNQLDDVIRKLKRELTRPHPPGPKSSMYELALSQLDETNDVYDEPVTDELHMYSPQDDRLIQQGFPCLSHISLTYFQDRLNMTALYRNQTFIERAYGNYLGLARLLRFITAEVGCEPGEITCIASHADAEFRRGIKKIQTLVQECQSALDET